MPFIEVGRILCVLFLQILLDLCRHRRSRNCRVSSSEILGFIYSYCSLSIFIYGIQFSNNKYLQRVSVEHVR